MSKLHTVEKWFWKSGKYTELELLNYFENDFKENIMGRFKASHSIVKQFNNFKTDKDRASVINAIGQTIINMILGTPTGRPLRKIPLSFLLKEDADELRTALCQEIQHLAQNRQFWERVNQSSMTTGSFTINSDATTWLINSDVFGQFAKTTLENSGIDQYEYVTDDEYIKIVKLGNVVTIGRVPTDQMKKLEI